MSGPAQMYLYIHEAILREVVLFEEQAKELNRDDPAEVEDYAARISWFHTMIKAHEAAEEDVLFPALENRYQHIASAYEFDHDHFEPNLFGEIEVALGGLGRANGNGERARHSRRLHRQSIALNELMRLHISKENELLVPIFEREFDMEEQVQIASQMAGSFQPQLMAETVGWMYDGQVATDREGMIRFLIQALPPEAFGGMAQMLARQGSSDDWADMERRIPELGQLGGSDQA